MEKVDIKDKKIIFHLLQNSRQPLSKIGKNVRQSKELVSYRVKRLQEKQIIKKFTTMTDASKQKKEINLTQRISWLFRMERTA